MFGEPFYEAIFDILGWDSETWAVPVVTWVAENTALLTRPMGVGIGIWVHYLAQRLISRSAQPAHIVDWSFLENEVVRVKLLIAGDIARKDEVEEGYSTIGQEAFSSFYALLGYLSKRDMAPESGIPNPKMMVDEDLFFELSTRYITTIGPYVRAKDAQGIKGFGDSIINLVYQWEREKRLESVKSENELGLSPTETEEETSR